MKDPGPLVKVEVSTPVLLDSACHTRWELTDKDIGQWHYWCREHQAHVPITETTCPGARLLKLGVHEVPASLAESLVKRGVAVLIEDVAPQVYDDGRLNQTLRQKGLPPVSSGDLNFMRQVFSSKPKSKPTGSGASPSKIHGLSQDDLDDMREALKGLRGRK